MSFVKTRHCNYEGTSEQFHSECKNVLDLDRLFCGKLVANQHILDLGMITYNWSTLFWDTRPKASACGYIRICRTLIYMVERIVYPTRAQILRIFRGHRWAPVERATA